MDGISTATIIIASIALVSSVVSNMRIRSRCHSEALGLDLSIQKRYNEDLGTQKQIKKQLKDILSSTSDEDSETD